MYLNNSNLKSIIVLGSNYSGSGAISDYLTGRQDICDPLNGKELQIVQNPYGIQSFYVNVYEAFFPTLASEALYMLEKSLLDAGHHRYGKRAGYGFESMIPGYKSKVNQYIRNITAHHYPFNNLFFNHRKNFITRFIQRVPKSTRNLLNIGNPVTMQRMPVNREEFIEATKQFLYSLIEAFVMDQDMTVGVLYDQAGSYWCPDITTKLFTNPKVVLVSRNPLDQFCELKVKKGLKDVNDFISWYKSLSELRSKSNYVDNEDILELDFETFVSDYDQQMKKLCKFIGLDENVPTNYKPESSKNNIGKYKNILSESEIISITSELNISLTNISNLIVTDQ